MRWRCRLALIALLAMPGFVSPLMQQMAPASDRITAAAFSPDGRLAALAHSGALTLVETETWKVLWKAVMSGDPKIGSVIDSLGFSRDGSRLAVCRRAFRSRSPIGQPQDPFLLMQLLESGTGRVLGEWSGSGATAAFAVGFDSGNSLLAVVARGNAEIILWNVSARKITPLYSGSSFRSCSAAFAPTGDLVALAVTTTRRLNEYELNLYETLTGTPGASLARGESRAANHPLAFSPDGRLLALGTEDWDSRNLKRGEIRIFDSAARNLIRSIRGIDVPVYSLQFRTGGDALLGLVSDPYSLNVRPAPAPPKLRIWDVHSGKLQKESELESPYDPAQSQGGRIVIVPGRNLFCIVGSLGGLSFYQPDDARFVKAITPADLGGEVAAGGSPAFAGPARSELPARGGRVVSAHRILAFSLTAQGRLLAGSDDGVLYVWYLVSASAPERVPVMRSVDRLAISPDGATMAAAADDDGTVTVGAAAGGAGLRSLAAFKVAVTALAFSPDGALLAAGGADGVVLLWRTADWKEMQRLQGHSGPVHALAFARDSLLLASGAADFTVRLWDLQSGRSLQTLRGHKGGINALAFGAGALASGADDATVILWDVTRGTQARKLSGHRGPVRGLSIAPDELTLVSGGDDGVRLWNAKDGKLIRVLLERRVAPSSRRPQPTPAFSESIWVAGFSPDGKVLACGGGNNSIMVWETATWKSRLLRAAF